MLNYLIVFVQIQLTSPLIRSFIEDVLHRRADLTGRMGVYNNVSGFMEGHWLLGYGYTSDHILEYTSSHWLGGIVNTQNGFLQIIYTVGLVGLVLYCALLFMLLKKIEKINTVEQKIVLLAAFVGFFVIAIVEIPLTSGVFNIIIGCVLLLSREEYQQETENSEG